MIRRFSLLFGLFLLVATLAASAYSAKQPDENSANRLMRKMTYYSLPKTDAEYTPGNSVPGTEGKETNSASMQTSSATTSPGVTVGNTVYEYQSNGSIKRQVQISRHHPDTPIVHFDWMYSPDAYNAANAKRTLRYNSYNAEAFTGDFMAGGAQDVSPVDANKRTGYVVGDVIPSLGEYLGVGHQFFGGITGSLQPMGWWDQGPGLGFWVDNRITDAVGDDPVAGSGVNFAWPACAHQLFGGQYITHILAHEQNDEQIKYFRKVGSRETGVWTVGLVLDTANNLGYEVYASKTTGKVVLAWAANIVKASDLPCDTCSDPNAVLSQWDNDIYIKTSTNAGATWGPRKNVTKNTDGVSGYRPYYDLSVMIDESDQVIVAWPTRQWPSNANQGGDISQDRCRIHFWRESFAPGVIRTVAGLEWDQASVNGCDGGAFKLNAGRIQVARCNGRTYVLWEQFNDFNAGILNDCAERAISSGGAGAANSDLYISISEDNGLTWDPARNITNTRTPLCDSATGAGGACQSEVYPTLTPFGHNYAGDFTAGGNQVPIAIPGTGASNSGYYLECQYILDPHAGGAIRPEGPWFLADVKWARIECDSSVKTPVFAGAYTSVGYPAYVKNGTFRDTNFQIDNLGNQNLSYSVTKFETAGPAGWLTFSNFSGAIPSGLSNVEIGKFRLNSTLASAPANSSILLTGGIVFASNAPSSPDTVKINVWVTDTLINPKWDSLFVQSQNSLADPWLNRKALAVSSNGGFGGGRTKLNLDFYKYGDCDSNKRRYLTDGTVLVAYPTTTLAGPDTAGFWTFSEDGFAAATGLRPIKGPKATVNKTCATQGFNLFYTGRFTTADSNITMEKTWYAPYSSPLEVTGHTEPDLFYVQALKVWNTSGAPISGVAIGEFTDWDIPSDSGSRNWGGINPIKNLIYLQGGEYDDTNPAYPLGDCQKDDLRFGGTRYLGGFKAATPIASPSSASVKEFGIELGGDGLPHVDTVWARMQESGWSTTANDSDNVIYMTYAKNQTLAVTNDTLRFYTAWLSVRNGTVTDLETMSDKALAWYTAKGLNLLSDDKCVASCCVKEGDANHNGSLNVVDITFLVNFLFKGGPIYNCKDEADANDNGSVNVVDITYLVNFLFKGGAITPCP